MSPGHLHFSLLPLSLLSLSSLQEVLQLPYALLVSRVLEPSFSWSYCLWTLSSSPLQSCLLCLPFATSWTCTVMEYFLDGVLPLDPVSISDSSWNLPTVEFLSPTLSLFLLGLRNSIKASLSYYKWLGLSTGQWPKPAHLISKTSHVVTTLPLHKQMIPTLLYLNFLCSTLPNSLLSNFSYFSPLKIFYLYDFFVLCSQRNSPKTIV